MKDGRYLELFTEDLFTLRAHPNIEHIATMEPKHIHQIRALHKFLSSKKSIGHNETLQFLYSIAKTPDASKSRNRANQLAFFQNVYQLLFSRDSGPRLAQFLLDADQEHILALLDI